MYRPQSFCTVNESVWTNFPHQGDGTNPPVPPLDCTDGWGVASLYNLIGSPTSPNVTSVDQLDAKSSSVASMRFTVAFSETIVRSKIIAKWMIRVVPSLIGGWTPSNGQKPKNYVAK
jgi:hypothetical protein